MKSLGSHGRANVTMTAQLDVHTARKLDFPKRLQNRWEFHFAVTEHEMLVNATPHILDVNIHDSWAPTANLVIDRQLALAMQVAEI
jgi:hypothetical protein|tara:strand:- start:6 stop:263 length:258 start_codon:yes stop_codon:yes gene_type:complete